MNLSQLPLRQTASVLRLNVSDSTIKDRLGRFGFEEGASIQLAQTHSSYQPLRIRIGNVFFAVDQQLAQLIQVKI